MALTPDGATLIPWIGGKYLTWDETVVHTCAASYIGVGSVGPALEQAANRKIQKYQGLPASHLFQPVSSGIPKRIGPSVVSHRGLMMMMMMMMLLLLIMMMTMIMIMIMMVVMLVKVILNY